MEKLQKFPTLIPLLQSSKIVEYLESLRDAGEIDSDLEYDNMLKTMLSQLNNETYKPLFNLINLKPGLSSANLFNFQLDQMRRDLEVLFLELANISSILKSHSDVFKDKYLDQIEYSLKDLNAKINNLRTIRESPSGFNDVSYSTFSDLSKLLNHNNENAADLYQDLRRLTFIQNNEIAALDKEEEVLTLPLDISNEISFLSVEIDQTNTTASVVNINLADSTTDNILDNEIGTYWYYNILSRKVLPNGASLVLHFDLNDKKEASFLVLQSVSEFPMFIESIEYIDEFNNFRTLDTDLGDRILDGNKKFTFDTITLQKIILTLKQFNTNFLSYNVNSPPLTLDDIKRDSNIKPTVSILSESISDNIEDPSIKENISITSDLPIEYEVFNHYVFGLDNAFMGKTQYLNNGLFITKPINIPRIGQMTIETSEIIPNYYNEILESSFLAGSIEYEIIKKDFSGKGDLLNTINLPILPFSQTSIPNEILFFNSDKKIISLRFRGHTITQDASNVIIYRNNEQMIRGIDWRFANRSNPGDDTDANITLNETVTKIEILHDDNTLANGIYTASYTPQYLLNPEAEVYFDTARTILYLSNNNIEFKIDRVFEVPETSNIFLKITLRNNTFLKHLTPKLEFYKLYYSTLI